MSWPAIDGAIQYELKIEDSAGHIASRTEICKQPAWRGELASGVFTYQVRAIDQFKRGGDWSEKAALVVVPPSPKVVFPREGDRIPREDDQGRAPELRWEKVDGAIAYHVRVVSGARVVLDQTLKEDSIRLPKGSSGPYKWEVRSVIAGGESSYESDSSESTPFRIVDFDASEFASADGVAESRRIVLAPELGITQNDYRSPSGFTFTQTSLTPKLSASYALVPQRWDLGGNLFVSAVSLRDTDTRSASVRYVGANLRAGYQVPAIRGDWMLKIYGGTYFTGLISDSPSMGYTIFGPQLYPLLSRAIGPRASISWYAKYSPVASDFQVQSLDSNEFATGVAYHFVSFGNRFKLGIDFARLSIHSADGEVRNRSLSFGMGVYF